MYKIIFNILVNARVLWYNILVNNFSTEPCRALLDRLSSPDKKLKIIHIAGTNGKGSTAEFFTRILIAAGKRVGTFTSPLVYDYCDQFRINGKPLTNAQINKYSVAVREVSTGINPSDFEVETAGAIYAFFKEGCEWAVIECGMGGLNDATNAIVRKELAVITSISLEHTEYLGKTVEEICAQKAGIIKDCPAVVNAYQSKEAIEFFKSIGVRFADKTLCENFEITAEGSLQPYNAATAILGARILGIDESAIRDGIKSAKPSGRLEIINKDGREYILDGAHNPAAFEPLQNLLRENQGSKTIIFGCLSDKDIDGNLKALENLADEIIAVECQSPRKTDLDKTKTACVKYFKNVKTAESVNDALSMADTETVVICGSFTLLREAKEWLTNSTGRRQ